MAKRKSDFQRLRDNKVSLTEDERKEVFRRGALWSYASSTDPNTGHWVQKVSAVWKSKKADGKFIFVTNTHRAYNTAPTLAGAISRYHKFIKTTA